MPVNTSGCTNLSALISTLNVYTWVFELFLEELSSLEPAVSRSPVLATDADTTKTTPKLSLLVKLELATLRQRLSTLSNLHFFSATPT